MMAPAVQLVIGRWYKFRTSAAYPKLVRRGELVSIRRGRCRLRGPQQGPVYVVPKAFVVGELGVEDVL